MRHLFKALLATAALTLTGCGNAQPSNSDGIKNIKFSSKGKPTKTLNTPNGAQEVYDPTQDPVIRKFFKEIYDHNRNPDNADVKYDYRRAGPTLRKARSIQHSDLLRAGCKSLIVPMCGIEALPLKRNPICRKLRWGSADLSKCEGDGIDTSSFADPQILREEVHQEPCISDLEGNPVPVVDITDIGPKSTKMPYDSFEDQLDGYFKAECRVYFK